MVNDHSLIKEYSENTIYMTLHFGTHLFLKISIILFELQVELSTIENTSMCYLTVSNSDNGRRRRLIKECCTICFNLLLINFSANQGQAAKNVNFYNIVNKLRNVGKLIRALHIILNSTLHDSTGYPTKN